MKQMRVFVGFSEVANYYTNLLKGFRELELEYLFIVFGSNKRNYDGDIKNNIIQTALIYFSKKIDTSENNVSKMVFKILHISVRVPLFFISLTRYNVFVFSYNSSFFGLYDLPILKFLNKTIVYVYHGSDSRPPYISGNYIYEQYTLEETHKITNNLYKKNSKVEKYADYIICHTASAQFFTKPIISFLEIGLPINLEHISVEKEDVENKDIKILHAPSAREQKGSDIFLRIINELIDDGYSIEYEELYNVPNREVLVKLSSCDFVIDELYSDTTLAGFATEAAYFSKPAVVGGYYAEIEQYMYSNPVPPSLYTDPDEIKSSIIKLLEDEKFRVNLGKEVKQYVNIFWTPKEVALRLIRVIEGKAPKEWFYDPCKIDYFYGWAVHKNDLKEFLNKYVGKFGEKGLFLKHNPNLKDRIMQFSERVIKK
jgi:hypothetical protein